MGTADQKPLKSNGVGDLFMPGRSLGSTGLGLYADNQAGLTADRPGPVMGFIATCLQRPARSLVLLT